MEIPVIPAPARRSNHPVPDRPRLRTAFQGYLDAIAEGRWRDATRHRAELAEGGLEVYWWPAGRTGREGGENASFPARNSRVRA